MARFELRNATVRLIDGYSNTAAVNDTLVTGDTEMDIDTVVGVDPTGDGTDTANKIIPLSTRFTVVGDTEEHTVTAVNSNARLTIDLDGSTGGTFDVTINGETAATIAYNAIESVIQAAIDGLATPVSGDFVVVKSGDDITITALDDGAYEDLAATMSGSLGSLTGGLSPTAVQTYAGAVSWNLTFTPAILTATGVPADDAIITITGRTLSIKVGDGNANFTENREYNYDLDRGILDAVRQGNDIPMDFSLDMVWEELTAIAGASTPKPEDVLHRRGPAAVWKSSAADPCEPYAIDVEIEHAPPCGSTGAEDITLTDFRWESLDYSAQDAQVSTSGRCNATSALVARG